ncbi:MAG: flagellar hook-basal body complex protein FliE [Deltaproteobacteria bacterium]|nr:flagellar hook-basal body complex protein FliE [Deltaproteobacteria bacterium]MBI4925147.1 flagellar hook-basal body complex protein FliE [Bdellovibrio sp.]
MEFDSLKIENLSPKINFNQDVNIPDSTLNIAKNITPELKSETSSKSFSELLKDSFEKVNEYQIQADRSVKELVAGRNKNIHETMLAVERADISLKLMMQVRNKLIDAYREIMRMQV